MFSTIMMYIVVGSALLYGLYCIISTIIGDIKLKKHEKDYEKEREINTENNIKFVHNRIQYIEEYFHDDRHVSLIVNRHKGQIVGFFIQVHKNTEMYDEFSESSYPTISHELSIDEFCEFITEYVRDYTTRPYKIASLLNEHKARLV